MKRKFWQLLALVALLGWLLWGNRALMVSEYIISDTELPAGFSGFRIAQISDLHNQEFGKKNVKLLSMLKETEPDVIFLTGDLVDSRNTQLQTSLDFVQEAMKIAPCYYVTGNHEARIKEYYQLEEELQKLGITVLRNEAVRLERGEDVVCLAGVDDPSFSVRDLSGDTNNVMQKALQSISENHQYKILLSHRPELFDAYVQTGMNLVFSGHAHGGQVRLPLVGGLVAPDQGVFPKYDAGLFKEGKTHMLVSRGVGNSIIPLRVNNRPEIVVVELRHLEE